VPPIFAELRKPFGEATLARDHRRLAAIVSADVVGYSLLMGLDDSATLAGLKAHRRELIDPKIAEYGGRIVKTTGDGLLLEFPSVVDAEEVGWAMLQRCRASLALGRYDDAIAGCERDIALDNWWLPHVYLVAGYALKGAAANAAAEKATLLQLRPDISIASFMALRYSDDPTYLQ